MSLLTRLMTALLVCTFMGGSQACAALCSMPANRASVPGNKAPEKLCHHCTAPQATNSQESKSTPGTPAEPCKLCQHASFDRLTPDRAESIPVPAILHAVIPDVLSSLTEIGRLLNASENIPPSPPPNERLHVVCTLLI